MSVKGVNLNFLWYILVSWAHRGFQIFFRDLFFSKIEKALQVSWKIPSTFCQYWAVVMFCKILPPIKNVVVTNKTTWCSLYTNTHWMLYTFRTLCKECPIIVSVSHGFSQLIWRSNGSHPIRAWSLCRMTLLLLVRVISPGVLVLLYTLFYKILYTNVDVFVAQRSASLNRIHYLKKKHILVSPFYEEKFVNKLT